MRFHPDVHAAITCVVLVVANSGCTQSPTTADSTEASAAAVDEQQAHPDEGPHHGELIELGNEEYHAEMLHDGDALTIYVLDGTATKTVPIESTTITMNVVHDGSPEQFALEASPDDSDPAGKSSRFTIKSADLVEHLDVKETKAMLVLTIDGTSYRGDVSHDHAGHNH